MRWRTEHLEASDKHPERIFTEIVLTKTEFANMLMDKPASLTNIFPTEEQGRLIEHMVLVSVGK